MTQKRNIELFNLAEAVEEVVVENRHKGDEEEYQPTVADRDQEEWTKYRYGEKKKHPKHVREVIKRHKREAIRHTMASRASGSEAKKSRLKHLLMKQFHQKLAEHAERTGKVHPKSHEALSQSLAMLGPDKGEENYHHRSDHQKRRHPSR